MTTTNLQDWIDENCPSNKYFFKYDKFQKLVAQGDIKNAMHYSDEAVMYEILSKYTQLVLESLSRGDLTSDFVQAQIKSTLNRLTCEQLNRSSRLEQLDMEADKQKYLFFQRLLKVV